LSPGLFCSIPHRALAPFHGAIADSLPLKLVINTDCFQANAFLAEMMAEYRTFGTNIAFLIERVTESERDDNNPGAAPSQGRPRAFPFNHSKGVWSLP
jgi:hypothetical protein